MNYAVEQRLRLIELLLAHYGQVGRPILMDCFGISAPQASRDILDYTKLAPDNCRYVTATKTHQRLDGFKRVWP